REISAEDLSIIIGEAQNGPESSRKNLLEILGWARCKEAIPFLLDSLQQPDTLETAAAGLVLCDELSVEPLLDRLEKQKEDPEAATLILNILNEISAAPDVHKIQNLTDHPSSEVRYYAYRLVA